MIEVFVFPKTPRPTVGSTPLPFSSGDFSSAGKTELTTELHLVARLK
jgi:hypothetical protein